MLLAGLTAEAQVWQDAYLFSQNDYGGTARSIALGNAMTALGGDAGSLTFNPAGSSVASYSQFMLTAGGSLSYAGATGTVGEGQSAPIGFGDQVSDLYGRFKMPNIGYIVNFDTGRRHGLKRTSVGFVMNTTNDFTNRFRASGVNSSNSFGGALASSAAGYSNDVMTNAGWFESGDLTRMPAWADMTAFRSGIISSVSDKDGEYISLSEVLDESGRYRLAAPINQKYGRQTCGYKSDWIMNFSANWNDKFFLGANLTVTSIYYNMMEYWEESPEDYDSFPPIKYAGGASDKFEKAILKRNYKLEGSGINAKVGALWIPIPGLRIGAAIQTPTINSVIERYGYSGQSIVSGKTRPAVNSAEDEGGYDITYPFRYNFGIAYSFGRFALVSADYECVDYSQARFSETEDEGSFGSGYDMFSDQNADIKMCLGISRMLRVGAEIKPVPGIAVRGGFGYSTSGVVYEGAGTTSASLGLGYSSTGSFFADFSLRLRFLPDEYVVPYYYYTAPDPSRYYEKVRSDVMTPEIFVRSYVADALVTVGWRF